MASALTFTSVKVVKYKSNRGTLALPRCAGQFTDADASAPTDSSRSALEEAAQLLQVSPDDLGRELCTEEIKVKP